MKNLEYIQEKLLVIGGKASFILSILTYFFLTYMVMKGGWTFFSEVYGDILVILTIGTAIFVQLSLYFVANRRQMKWLYLPVIAFTLAIILIPAASVKKISEPDPRGEQWDNLIYRLREKK